MKSLRLMLCAMPLMLTGCSTMSSVNWSAANPWNWFGSSTKVSEQGVGELTALPRRILTVPNCSLWKVTLQADLPSRRAIANIRRSCH